MRQPGRIVHILVLGAALVAACKKKTNDDEGAPPPRPTDWNAELADVVEGDVSALCSLRTAADKDKAAAAVARIDEVAAAWKTASLTEMRERTAASGTEPKLVAFLEARYARPGHPCEHRIVAAGSILSYENGLDDAFKREGWQTGTFSSKGFASLLATVTGPWIDVVPIGGKEIGHVVLLVDFRSAGTMTFGDDFVPRLAGETSVRISEWTGDKLASQDVIPLGAARAEEGTIKYRGSGNAGRASANAALVSKMLGDVSSATIQLLEDKAGIGKVEPTWAALAGVWSFEGGPMPTKTCASVPTKRSIWASDPIVVDSRARSIWFGSVTMRAKLLGGGAAAGTVRDSSECGRPRDRLDIAFSADRAKVTWTFHTVENECKPCTVTLEAPIKKRN